ncbi:MAG TPA: hypothetical protein VF623_06035 [Segetibacter sp.]
MAKKLTLKDIQFSPNAWLMDTLLNKVSVDVRGFWIDLLCYMHSCFPYGHLSKIPDLEALRKEGYEADGSFHSMHVDIPLHRVIPHAVPDYEGFMKMAGYTSEEVMYYIKILKGEGIASCTDNGIIYSRRMRRDHLKKVRAFKNGSKGGHPSSFAAKEPAKV